MSTSQQNNRNTDPGGQQRPAAKKRRRRRRPIVLTILLRIFQAIGTLLLVGILTGCFVACYATVYIQTVIIPDAGLDLSQYTLNESSRIVYTDRETGEIVEMRTLSGTEDREWINYEDIPDYFIEAAVAIEDERFWKHQGVDWKRTAAAIVYMFTGRDIQGGSTITQQLIKNLTGDNEVTVKRKVGEIFNALAFEQDYEKTDIITWYLNKIYLGQSKYGIVTAARYYFGKDVDEITLAEAASIIAITNNPSIYSPASTVVVENSRGVPWTAQQWNKYRQELILAKMLEEGYITQAEHDAAVAEELNFVFDDETGETSSSDIFSWYEEAAISEVVDYLKEEHGLSSETAFDIVYGGGLVIYTAFDPDIQACVDEIYSTTDNLPYISRDGQQMQSAITIVDNKTGYVVAMAGKIGEKTGNRQLNYATDSTRQPGSSFKPLAVYSPAIEMGLITPGTIIDDSPYTILEGTSTAWPYNENRTYSGLVSVHYAVARSLNTVATKLLGDYVTPEASYQFLTERYGLTTLVEGEEINGSYKSDILVAPLALGGLTKGVTTFEMAAAFATFPRMGAYTEPTTVLRVETKAGQLVWDNEPETEYVIKESTAYYMNTMLTNAVAGNGTGISARVDGQIVAGKTGTTNDNFDRWFVGYTDYYTAAVWTGYPINASIVGITLSPAGTLFSQVMALIHEDLERKSFATPQETVPVTVCLDCGQVATEACSNDIRTVLDGTSRIQTFEFMPNDVPNSFCTCHVPVTICTEAPVMSGTEASGAYHLANSGCPEESVAAVYIVDYERTEVASSVWVRDKPYMTAYYEALGYPECTVHSPVTEEPVVPPVEGPGEGTGEDGGQGEVTPPVEGTPPAEESPPAEVTPAPDDPNANFDWDSFDPFDISTWPFDPYSDPSTWPFDPFDQSTWPNAGEGGAEEPDGGDTEGGTETPPDDEYLPAGS